MIKLPDIDFLSNYNNKNSNTGVKHLEKSVENKNIPTRVLVNKPKTIMKPENKKIVNEKYYNENKAKILQQKSKNCIVKKSLAKELELFLNDMPEKIVRSGTYNIKVKNKAYTLKLCRKI